MTNEPDFEQPATALWIREPLKTKAPEGEKRDFASLAAALRFVMNLPLDERNTARIQTDSGSYSVEQIEELHQRL